MMENNTCHTIMENLPTYSWNIAFGISIILVAIFAFVENSFILMLYYKYPKIRTPSNYILISVVVADWLTGLTAPIYSAQLLIKTFRHNCAIHKVRRIFGVTIMGASLTSIIFLTIDRSRHLILLRNYTMKMKWIYIGLIICWLGPVGVAFIGLLHEKIHSDIILAAGVILIGIIVFCYVLVIIALRNQRNGMEDPMRLAEYEKKAVKTVVIIITCYLVMLFPHVLDKGLYGLELKRNTDVRAEEHMFTVLLIIANSIVNPIIYASRIRVIRKYTLRHVGSKRRQTKTLPLGQVNSNSK